MATKDHALDGDPNWPEVEYAIRVRIDDAVVFADRDPVIELVVVFYNANSDFLRYHPGTLPTGCDATSHRMLAERLKKSTEKDGVLVTLVPFLPDAYEKWRTSKGLEESRKARTDWAVEQLET